MLKALAAKDELCQIRAELLYRPGQDEWSLRKASPEVDNWIREANTFINCRIAVAALVAEHGNY